MNNLVIEIDNLSYNYPDGSRGIYNIHLAISQGEFIILAGRNGSGKSTLLRHLNALIPSKQVKICGNTASEHIRETRKNVGMVFQDADTQIVGDTVFDDVAFGLENLKFPRDQIHQKVRAQLEVLELSAFENRHPATLSGGEKRKLALAGILVMSPRILVFDEPFSNLDFPATRTFVSLIHSLHQSGHTIIVSTHDIETVLPFATRMMIMEAGTIAADDLPEALMNRLESFGIKNPYNGLLKEEITI